VDEVEAAVFEASPDVHLGNIVAAFAHTGPDTIDVALDAVEAGVPDPNLRALVGRLGKQLRHRARAERGLEGEIELFGDGALEQAPPLLPRDAVGFRLAQPRVGRANQASRLVGVVVRAAGIAIRGSGDAALAGAVDTGQRVDAMGTGQERAL
jgi:hypothetical protein